MAARSDNAIIKKTVQAEPACFLSTGWEDTVLQWIKWLKNNMDTLMQVGVKLLYSGVLILLIVVFAHEIWKVWWDRTLVLAPFTYTRDGSIAQEAGQNFTQLVSQDLRRLHDIYTGTATTVTAPIASTDQAGRGGEISLPIASSDILPAIEIEAYGIQVTQLLRRFSRWIRRPHEIAGNVSEVNGHFDLYAEVRRPMGADSTRHLQWYLNQLDNLNQTSRFLACRVLRYLQQQKSPKLFTQNPANTPVDDTEFCLFLFALEAYQIYRTKLNDLDNLDEAKEQLKAAKRILDQLLARSPRFPFTYKLAAYVYMDVQKPDEALSVLDRYEKSLAMSEHTDESMTGFRNRLLARLERTAATAPAATPSARVPDPRSRQRPVYPGLSLGSIKGGAGTVCCVVRNPQGKRFLLTSDHVVPVETGEPVTQPGSMDGGTGADRVGTLARKIEASTEGVNRSGGALVALQDDTEATNNIPGVNGINAHGTVPVGTKIQALGRTSGLVTGEIVSLSARVPIYTGGAKPIVFAGLIQTTPISQPGDSGAPVLTEDGSLIGFVYAGSDQSTLVMPIGPVLEDLDVELDL